MQRAENVRLFFVGGWAGMHPREKRRCASKLESLERKKENQADVRLSNLASRVRKARLGGSSVQLHLPNKYILPYCAVSREVVYFAQCDATWERWATF